MNRYTFQLHVYTVNLTHVPLLFKMSYDFYPMYMLKDCQSSMLSLTLFKECDQDLKVDMGCDGYIVHIAANCLS